MGRKRNPPEQSVTVLREAGGFLSQGAAVAEAFRKLRVTEQTYYRVPL